MPLVTVTVPRYVPARTMTALRPRSPAFLIAAGMVAIGASRVPSAPSLPLGATKTAFAATPSTPSQFSSTNDLSAGSGAPGWTEASVSAQSIPSGVPSPSWSARSGSGAGSGDGTGSGAGVAAVCGCGVATGSVAEGGAIVGSAGAEATASRAETRQLLRSLASLTF